MANNKSKSVLRSLFGILAVGLLFLCLFTYIKTKNALTGPNLPDISDPVPTPPGQSSSGDELWLKCATSNRRSACDELYNLHASRSGPIYQGFASTCGGRVEMVYEDVDCSTQLKYQETPPTVAVLPWNGKEIGSLCVTIKESYKKSSLSDISYNIAPIKDSNFISNLHRKPFFFMIVESGCDANVNVDIHGSALREYYVSSNRMSGGLRWAGATVTGTVSLTAQGSPSLIQEIDVTNEPPGQISGAFEDWEDAPFCETFGDGIRDVFKDWFGEALGNALKFCH